MPDPLKELDKALGILSDVETIKEEPWNYVHKKDDEPIIKGPDNYIRHNASKDVQPFIEPFKSPAQELVDTGQVSPVVDMSQDIDSDYEYQRQNFYNLVERGNDAITGILELAKESEHPRTYEVAGNLIKQVAEVTEKLGDLQEKMKKLKEVPDNAPKNVTNALFVGSTAELQKMIKDS
tara:strand:+ start:290 stop:826 length:537 start_codon:yes stop_codon:yes gene_type:complete